MGMTIDEYRSRMIQAFHNAECDNLIALVVFPSEKEFEHLEWLLKNHYKTPKDQYEARLKSDLEAILVKLQMEINEMPINPKGSEAFRLGQATAYDRCEFLIQHKINELKGDKEGEGWN